MLGGTWKIVKESTKEIENKKELTDKDIALLAYKLGTVYSITLVQFKTLTFMAKEISETYNMRLVDMKEILELLVKDEENNAGILQKIEAFTKDGENKNSASNTPPIIHQTPVNWY